ncbi:hypothetical protein ABT112_02495 [Streptomyces sp. NPDC002055]|uniref:hypothetical protein n=1 Tax=Streptomyces sp. NPDC002055 TaxID=3154534 RepID=UPI00332A236C
MSIVDVTTGRPAPGPDPRGDAEAAVRELAGALAAAGLVLPSLWVDPHPALTGTVLVELGRARPGVVRRLAELVAKGAAAPSRGATA